MPWIILKRSRYLRAFYRLHFLRDFLHTDKVASKRVFTLGFLGLACPDLAFQSELFSKLYIKRCLIR